MPLTRLRSLRLTALAAVLSIGTTAVRATAPPPSDLLVVLSDTGRPCANGSPRLTRHPDARRYLDVLGRGYSGTLLRLYRHVQLFRQRTTGAAVEPAYLLLSTTEGGCPRFGFCLDDEAKPGVGYVDLHRSKKISGVFAAIDQIFPHELLHVITHQLAGSPPEGGSNQVHAVGVKTDRFQAFTEGFAEHAQVMAIDDPDAPADTAALARDGGRRDRAWRNLEAYRRALAASHSLAPRHILGFVFWFSNTEQVLRYHAVKANLFAHEPAVPPSLLATPDPWAAYLLENILPGEPGAPLKSAGRLAATEGVVAAVMTRWITSPTFQQRRESPAFYAAFASAGAVSPLENAYLKLFRVLADHHPHDLVTLARAYAKRYPEEAGEISAVLSEAGVDVAQSPAEIWLASDRFRTGTTLFDQYRGLRRAHTFDLNAASPVDLATVNGLEPDSARALRSGMPYASLEEVAAAPGVPGTAIDELRRMQAAFRILGAESAGAEASLNLWAVFWPTLWRAAFWIAVAASAGALLYRPLRRLPWWRLTADGFGAAIPGLAAAWVVDAPWWFGPAVPLVILAVPAVLWQAYRRQWADALRVAAAWLLAVLPTVFISQPLG